MRCSLYPNHTNKYTVICTIINTKTNTITNIDSHAIFPGPSSLSLQLSLLTRFLTEVETCLRTGNVIGTDGNEVNNVEEGTNKVNNAEEAAFKNEANIETSCKSGRKKVKKKVLVKKPKGEKSSDPIKKDILGEALLFLFHDYRLKNIC